MKKNFIIPILICPSILLLVFFTCFSFNTYNIPSENIDAVLSVLEDDTSNMTWPTQSNIKLNTKPTASTNTVKISGSQITITQGGNYVISGTLSNGSIIVDTTSPVNLTLSNASITNLNGPAIYIKNAEETYITLISNTQNYLVDSSIDMTSSPSAAIYSSSSLTFQGGGMLDITSLSQNGIGSNSPITFNNGMINVSAGKNAIDTSGTTYLRGGHLSLTASETGITAAKGLIITDGILNISNSNTAIASGMTFTLDGGMLNMSDIQTGIYSLSDIIINDSNMNIFSSQNALLATGKERILPNTTISTQPSLLLGESFPHLYSL